MTGRPIVLFQIDGGDREDWLGAAARAWPESRAIWAPDASSADLAAATVAIVWRPPGGFLGSLPSLRIVVSTAAGLDHLAGDRSLPPTLPVLRRQDPATAAAMSEYVLAAVLAQHRDFPRYAADQAAGRWIPCPAPMAAERRVIVLGLGPLGLAAGALLATVGFGVAGWSRSRKPDAAFPTLAGWETLHEALSRADTLVNLLPSTPDTRGLLDGTRMDLLPAGATLVHAGRGDTLVLDELLARLDTGRIGHAALDVLPEEPPPPASPLWHHPRVTLTPHIAALPLPEPFLRWVAATLNTDL
ncbi:NAD(P)-dependent oxidoreductase [Inquilinus sp.]|uniref:NAD(P)-dependent oxidoreductase n=1 Tax=Inquilinus sp. TaxID=1932117 RepID=UPI0031E15C12